MYQAVCRECFWSPVKKSPRQSPYKVSPSKKSPYKLPLNKSPSKTGETPTVLGEKLINSLANATNRQLFVNKPPRV